MKYLTISMITTLLLTITPFHGGEIGPMFPLEITQPQAGLSTTNRFYKAYPGLEYNVRAAVIGGVYPYVYSLRSAPAGMRINAKNGVIIWENPTTAGSPHTVTLRVTDSENTTHEVSWTITVTMSGFVFLDPAKGQPSELNGGKATGSIDNPFKTLRDIYEGSDYPAKRKDSYAGYFVYFRGGTYFIDTFIENIGNEEQQQTAFINNLKPMVWLAYPNETPIIDFQNTKTHIFYEHNRANSIYIDGLHFRNMLGKTLEAPSAATPIFRRLTMYNHGASTGSYNQTFIQLSRSTMNPNVVIQDCTFHTLDHGAAIKIYCSDKILIEDNLIHDLKDTASEINVEGIALKCDVQRATVRGNKIYNVPYHPIGGNMNSEKVITGEFEVLYNYVSNPKGCAIRLNHDGKARLMHVHRNTFLGRIEVNKADRAADPKDLFIINNNVIIYDFGPHIIATNWEVPAVIDSARIVIRDNLTGTTADGILDSLGNLTSGYRKYIGARGWQVGYSPEILP